MLSGYFSGENIFICFYSNLTCCFPGTVSIVGILETYQKSTTVLLKSVGYIYHNINKLVSKTQTPSRVLQNQPWDLPCRGRAGPCTIIEQELGPISWLCLPHNSTLILRPCNVHSSKDRKAQLLTVWWPIVAECGFQSLSWQCARHLTINCFT